MPPSPPRRAARPACSLLWLALIGLLPTAGAPAPENIEPTNRVPYRIIGDTTLALHVFTPSGPAEAAPRPALLLFFGGGWRKGSPAQFYPHARHLADRGLVVFLPEYRVEERDGTDPVASVADAKAAVRWVRRHAADWNVDTGRIGAGGGSAGGHLAAAAALVDGFDDPSAPADVSCVPDALVLFNPVIDNGPDGYGYPRLKDHFPAISPLHNIGPATPPPTVFMVGTRDPLVPVTTARDFADRIRAAGGRCDLHLYETSGHGFFNYRAWGNLRFYETLRATERFLASLGWLDGEPTLKIPSTASLTAPSEPDVP